MESKLIVFLRDNKDDLGALERLSNNRSFSDWTDNVKNHRIIRRLETYHEEYMETPEDVVINKENNKQMILAAISVRDTLGKTGFNLLIERYCYGMTLQKIGNLHGCSKQYVGRKIHQHLRQAKLVIKKLINDELIDIDVLKPAETFYTASTPKIKVKYPYESAFNTQTKSYVYNKHIKYKTECRIPEYLELSFKDNKTICSYCQNSHGDSTCSRKEYYRKVGAKI